MKRLLHWIASFLPCRIISDNGQPYLERYYVVTLFGVRFYLHRFVGSDPARGLHDHPWRWARSIILSGWYYEERRDGRRKVRWYNKLAGDNFHRVILPSAFLHGWTDWNDVLPCWTLFFHDAEYVKPWGFLRRLDGETAMLWIPHNYPKDGSGTPDAWWETAPRGKHETRRAAA